MLRTFAFSVLLMLGLAMPATDVMAQSSAGRGAVGGAIIGGAVGGRRGAAIGAATGAAWEPVATGVAAITGVMVVVGCAPAEDRIPYLLVTAGDHD